MMTRSHTVARRRFPLSALIPHPSSLILLFFLSGCHRAPQTAAELQGKLPRQFRGDILLQGDAQPHHLVVEPHDFSVKDARLLEFNRVRYQVLAGGEVMAEGDAAIRGTISTPDLEIHIEQADADGGDAMKPDTFKGHLSADLRTAEAAWTGGLGQPMKLKVTATAP